MDRPRLRPRRVLTEGTLVLMLGTIVATAGCRGLRNEVPSGKPYSTTGGTPPTVGFNSDPRPNAAVGGLYGNGPALGQPGLSSPGTTPGTPSPDAMSSGSGPGATQLGTPAPGSAPYGVPPGVGRNAPSATPSIPGTDTGR